MRGPSALRVLVRIRLAEIVRRPSGAFWFFALPLVLLGVLAGLFANGHPFERHHVVVVADSLGIDPSSASRSVQGVRGAVFDVVPDEARARARLESRAAVAAVVDDRVIVDEEQYLVGQGLVVALGGKARLEVVSLPASGYTQFLVPGVLAQGVVIAGLFGMGYAMVRYRQSRFLRKLATTPLSKSTFVLSQIVARVILVTLQLVLMLVVARLAFGISMSAAAVGWVVVIGALGLVTFMGIGFCISCVVETEGNVVDIINALSVPIAMLSEIFFSSSELPTAVRWVSSALPSTAMVRSFRSVLLYHDDPMQVVVPSLGVLAAWAVVTYAIAVRSFKWR